tara:strand:- start:189 stop:983 length:795 start_codon:yes stop_codon:yes gene_type:complete
MAWWGKLIGGTLGFMIGGPIGALLGGSIGHKFDNGRTKSGVGLFNYRSHERIQLAFFTATFSVMGHIAKADGRVSEHEIQAAKSLMLQMQLNEEQRSAAIDLFNKGKEEDFPLDAVLEQFRAECHRRTTVLRMFFEIQIQAALADGKIDLSEKTVLYHAGEKLGFNKNQIEQLIQFVSSSTRGSASNEPLQSLDEAYKLLGVTSKSSDTEVKKAYRRLTNQHHPDKLVAKGMPEEMVKLANEKTQEIRRAWERIRDYRHNQSIT